MKSFFTIAMLLLCWSAANARGWRGLVPLHSTRQDVERLLGKTTDFYNLKNETVYIDFSSGTCDSEESYKVPIDTVTHIMVIPKWEPSLDEMKIDIARYKKEVDGNIKEHVFYWNDEGSESIEVFDGKIESLTYTPLASEASLKCYSTYEEFMNAHGFVCGLPGPKFDEFGALSIRDERARLDNFAIHLHNQPPTSRGWIRVYEAKQGGREAALRRANRIKHYLVKQRGLTPGRVLTMAGTDDNPRVELWIWSVGSSLPGALP